MVQLLVLVMGMLLVAGASAEDAVSIHNGFVKGEQLLNMPEPRQRAYAMGLVDGLFLAPLVGAPKSQLLPFERCVEGMTDSQITAILVKYVRERPARWHESAHALLFGALRESCVR